MITLIDSWQDCEMLINGSKIATFHAQRQGKTAREWALEVQRALTAEPPPEAASSGLEKQALSSLARSLTHAQQDALVAVDGSKGVIKALLDLGLLEDTGDSMRRTPLGEAVSDLL